MFTVELVMETEGRAVQKSPTKGSNTWEILGCMCECIEDKIQP